MNMSHVRYGKCRLERKSTGSWLTIKLSEALTGDEWEKYVGIKYPEWEFVSCDNAQKPQRKNR
jgi:hypothetical protein